MPPEMQKPRPNFRSESLCVTAVGSSNDWLTASPNRAYGPSSGAVSHSRAGTPRGPMGDQQALWTGMGCGRRREVGPPSAVGVGCRQELQEGRGWAGGGPGRGSAFPRSLYSPTTWRPAVPWKHTIFTWDRVLVRGTEDYGREARGLWWEVDLGSNAPVAVKQNT